MAKKNTTVLAKQIAVRLEDARIPHRPWHECSINTTNIDVAIEGFGPIKLPMRPADVRKLRNVAKQAPYGKGTQTLVDTDVRDTLEVDASFVNLNEKFFKDIQRTGFEIAESLNLEPNKLKFELYKLLIYPKGGFFLPHRDSEKSPGMVATMVVVLPSRFGGGDLVIKHQNLEKRFSFDKARQQEKPQGVMFYADCEHEVKKVTSGVRVCLAFNAILKRQKKWSPPKKSASGIDSGLQQQIANWIRHHPTDPLVFALEHQYTQTGLKSSQLKGSDKDLHQNVAAIANSLDCQLFFGQVERHLCNSAFDGYNDYYYRRGRRRRSQKSASSYQDLEIGEVIEDDISIDGWRTQNGKLAKLNVLGCQESQLVSITPVQDWVPTKQDYEGYTGNAGNTLDRWYHKSVLAIWPTQHHFDIMAQMGVPFAIEEWKKNITKLPTLKGAKFESAYEDSVRLAQAIINRWPDRKYEHSVVDRVWHSQLKAFASKLPDLKAPELIVSLLGVLARRDWHTEVNTLVPKLLKLTNTGEAFEALRAFIQFDPPPNEYGIRFLEGLAQRDAKWLLKLASQKQHGGLSKTQLNKLLEIAYQKHAAHVNKCEQKGYRRRQKSPNEIWVTLCQALILTNHKQLPNMFGLVNECRKVFDLRNFQTSAAVTLKKFAATLGDGQPKSLQDWLAGLELFFTSATSQKPVPPKDFRRPSDTECNCDLCDKMSEFLANPDEEETQIRAAEYDRDHLTGVIIRQKLDVTTELIKRGSPYSLQLTKTTDSYRRDLAQYEDDLKLLKKLQ